MARRRRHRKNPCHHRMRRNPAGLPILLGLAGAGALGYYLYKKKKDADILEAGGQSIQYIRNLGAGGSSSSSSPTAPTAGTTTPTSSAAAAENTLAQTLLSQAADENIRAGGGMTGFGMHGYYYTKKR